MARRLTGTTHSLLKGFNFDPVALESLRVRQQEEATRRSEYAQQRGDQMNESLVNRMFKERAAKAQEDDASFYRGLRGKELEDAVAARAEARAQSQAEREQQSAYRQEQGALRERETVVREDAEKRYKAEDAETARKLQETEHDMKAGDYARQVVVDVGQRSGVKDLDDESWRQAVARLAEEHTGSVANPYAGDPDRFKRAVAREIESAAKRRAQRRKEEMDNRKAQQQEEKERRIAQDEDDDRAQYKQEQSMKRIQTRYNVAVQRVERIDNQILKIEQSIAGLEGAEMGQGTGALKTRLKALEAERAKWQSVADDLEERLTAELLPEDAAATE